MTAPRVYFLKTDRLGFSRWAPDDLPLALALWGDPEVTRLIGGPLSADAVEARLGSEIATMRAHGVQYWPIFLLANDAHAGCAGLRPYPTDAELAGGRRRRRRPKEPTFELGFHLLPAYWGRGLATEAARAVITFAFETLGAHALFAGHHPANATSRRVLEKLGFRFTHEELYPPTGLRHPSYLLPRAGTPAPRR